MSFRRFVSRSKHMIHYCRVQVTKLRLLCFNGQIERLPNAHNHWDFSNSNTKTDLKTRELRCRQQWLYTEVHMCPTILLITNIKQDFVRKTKCNKIHEDTHQRIEVSFHDGGWTRRYAGLYLWDVPIYSLRATKVGWNFSLGKSDSLSPTSVGLEDNWLCIVKGKEESRLSPRFWAQATEWIWCHSHWAR